MRATCRPPTPSKIVGPRVQAHRMACAPRAVAQAASGSLAPSVNGVARRAAAAWVAALMMLSPCTPALAAAAVSPGQVLQGAPRVVDGDTLVVQGQRIRLYGVDAPEQKQMCASARGNEYACGQASRIALEQRVGKLAVRCTVREPDQYGRAVSKCTVLDGRNSEDVGAFLVANGQAVAYRQYSKDYIVLEEKAHAMHKGMWQGTFTEPRVWRRTHHK